MDMLGMTDSYIRVWGPLKISKEEINEGRQLFHEFRNGHSGGFYTALFVAIGRADIQDTKNLAKGFPGLVYAYLEHNDFLSKVEWECFEVERVKRSSIVLPFKRQE